MRSFGSSDVRVTTVVAMAMLPAAGIGNALVSAHGRV
jgi:hypothetical protein